MVAQGLLGFQYEQERCSGGLTSLAGLPLYLELIVAGGLAAAIRRHVHVAGEQGWLDLQMVLAVVFFKLGRRRLRRGRGSAAIRRWVRGGDDRDRTGIADAQGAAHVEGAVAALVRARGAVAVCAVWVVGARFADPYAPPAEAGTAGILQATVQLQGLWRANQASLEIRQWG